MKIGTPPQPMSDVLSDRELMLNFESIGDNCELGLVQRKAGAEPLGLLRFSGVPVHHLIAALDQRFAGIAEPENIRLQVENGEYMVKLTKYDFIYHAWVQAGQMEPAALHAREVRRTGFLTNKLISDLESPAKILVFRQNEPVLAHDLALLRGALGRYGTNTVLWVLEAQPGHPPGTVEVADDHLLLGYVRWLAPRDNAHKIDHAAWLSVCRAAYAIWHSAETAGSKLSAVQELPAAAATPAWVEAVFGRTGNGPEKTGSGWSAPENGFTWAIGERSLLVLDAPPAAEHYALEFDIIPFRAPPLVPEQRLTVSVNGTPVHRFGALPRGRSSCGVPGHLLHGRDKVEILLEHPDAARPCDVAGEKDDRRLAIAFRTLTLQEAPG
jgi:hypothetical protein